ncbi:MAG: hypothetical protein WBD22_03215 [Pyrinomonadaceae bacterium]
MAGPTRSLKRKLLQAGGWQLAKRGAKMLPFGGTLVVIALVGNDVKNKGFVRGVVNSGLDSIPIVGLAKNAVELVLGDFLPDKKPNERSNKE